MTETDKLRAMLDELEVEYTAYGGAWALETYWKAQGGRPAKFSEHLETGSTVLHHVTAGQAVAATLGPGECRDVSKTHGRWKCSECGRSMGVALDEQPPGCCPGCGRKVKR